LKVYDKFENWKIYVIFNNTDIRENPFFDKSAYLLWYREIKSSNWVYEMYHLKDIDIITGQAKPWAQKIDIYSDDYFKIWNNILFTEDRIFLESLKLKTENWKYLEIKWVELDPFMRDKTIRIKDIVKFYENWQLNQNDYIKYIKQAQNIILEQIWDERADAHKDPITQKELSLYKKYNLIPESLYNQAKKKIENLVKAKKKKSWNKRQIHSQAHLEVSEVYQA
jgi:hypothetical protein